MSKRGDIHKTGSALMSDEDRAVTTDNVYGKFRDVWHVVFEICKPTDRQTDSLVAILRTHSRDEVNRPIFKDRHTYLSRKTRDELLLHIC